jgi:hypothetical protein
MPTTMSRKQYDEHLDALCDRYRNGEAPVLAARLNEALSNFKAGVVIVESAPAPRKGATAPLAKTKGSKRARRISRIVSEALTAAAAPRPASGTGGPAKPKATANAPNKALHEMSGDELAAATVSGVDGPSPFWRPRESAPAAPIAESTTAPTERDLADPASLSGAGLDEVFGRVNQRRGLVSPLWAA